MLSPLENVEGNVVFLLCPHCDGHLQGPWSPAEGGRVDKSPGCRLRTRAGAFT